MTQPRHVNRLKGVLVSRMTGMSAADGKKVALSLVVTGLVLAVTAAGINVASGRNRHALDNAFREMTYPNAEIERPIQRYVTISEGYYLILKTTDNVAAVLRRYEALGFHFSDCSPKHDGSNFATFREYQSTWRYMQVGVANDHVSIQIWVRRNDRSVREFLLNMGSRFRDIVMNVDPWRSGAIRR